MAWQLPWVQTVYGYNITVVAISHWTSQYQISARDTYIFLSCENGAFLLMEATVCCWFYYWSEVQVVPTTIIMQSAYTSVIERSLLKWNGHDCNSPMHDAIVFYCFHVTMFWRYCQISGSGSNSLNLQKLPDHFSYGLGMRQWQMAWHGDLSPTLVSNNIISLLIW